LGASGVTVAVGDVGLGSGVGGRVAAALGVGVGTVFAVTVVVSVAVAAAGTVTVAVAPGDGSGVAVTASATVTTDFVVRTGDVGVAVQFVRSSARNRIRVRVPRIMVVCLLVSDPRWGDRVMVQIEPDCLSGRYAGG
jgi:hypothetical protein